MTPDLAIVILNFNGAAYLRKFLPSVLQNSQGFRVVVADNASTDNSIQLLQENFPEVELLQLSKNHGFAGGYNEALKKVSATYYLLLNSDVEVTPGWLDPLLHLLESDPEIAACQPKIRSWHQPEFFEYAGAAGGYLDQLAYPFCRGRIFDTLEKDKGQYNEAVQVFWATGACMAIRSRVFHELGGFDARFFAHMEEIDLCWRIYRSGYKVYACPESVVYHVGGGTLPKSNPQKTFLNFRNGLWMLLKNSSFGDLAWKLPLRLGLDYLAAFRFGLQGRLSDSKAILKAHIYFWQKVPEYIRERITEKEPVTKKAPLYQGVILWNYYGKGIRKFSYLKKKRLNKGKIQKAF